MGWSPERVEGREHASSPRIQPQASPAFEAQRPTATIQPTATSMRARTGSDVLALQRTVGNRTIQRRLAGRREEREMASSGPSTSGLPHGLRAGLEQLSGLAMGDVRVHYNSEQPRTVGAEAFATDSQIHVAPGAEQHLAHEAWHVVQQRQGRVAADSQVGGVAVNTSAGLEREADRFGRKAQELGGTGRTAAGHEPRSVPAARASAPVRQLWAARAPADVSNTIVRSAALEPLVGTRLRHASTAVILQATAFRSGMFDTQQKRMQVYETAQDNFEVYHATTLAKATGILHDKNTLHRGRNYISRSISDYTSRGYIYFGLDMQVPTAYGGMNLPTNYVVLRLRLPQGTLIQADPEAPDALRAPIDLPWHRCAIVENKAMRDAARLGNNH